jgi:hypothetical protein
MESAHPTLATPGVQFSAPWIPPIAAVTATWLARLVAALAAADLAPAVATGSPIHAHRTDPRVGMRRAMLGWLAAHGGPQRPGAALPE